MNIEEIRELSNSGFIRWTAHIVSRLQERGISPFDIRQCINNGEIIENYPSDYPHPSCLILGKTAFGESIHIVAGIGADMLWLITAYIPGKDEWHDDFKTRRNK